ncbi:MAG: hypothetical protein J6B48_09515 [Clostridia bacterium]|nr:hypothetical protein [Clostridia bacterium]
MICEYKKYKGVAEFVKNEPERNSSKPFTIIHKCKGCTIVGDTPTLNNHCFGCLFCIIGNAELKKQFESLYGWETIANMSSIAFSGAVMKPRFAQKGVRHPYTSIEKFTSVDETTNIQPWATGLLHHMCSKSNRIGMEVPIFHPDYDRNGRLDICSITEDHLLVMESKTTLDDALSDERFVEQHTKYTEVINDITNEYTYLTLLGGNETDIYPKEHAFCTGTVGNKAERFHKLIIDNNIRVITANALWCLCCKYLVEGNEFAWDTFLINVFRDPNCIGLVSAGKMCVINDKIEIVSIF